MKKLNKKINLRYVGIFVLAAFSGGLLLHVSQMVQQAEDDLSRMGRAVEGRRDSLRVLDAEWAYLNSPQNLEKLAKEYLDITAPRPDAIVEGAQDVPPVLQLPSEDVMQAQPVFLQVPAPQPAVTEMPVEETP